MRFTIPRSLKAGRLRQLLLDGELKWRDLYRQRVIGIGNVTIDVGANIGTTSIPRIVGGDAQLVYALEPELANYQCLVHNVLANQLCGFVLPERAAVADHTGTGHLQVASRMANHALVSTPGERTVPVQTWRLDDWTQARGIDIADISVVKADTQGWEAHVLRGAPQLVAARHIAWILEVSPKHLSSAGTSMPDFLALLAACFTHAIDLGQKGLHASPIATMGDRLAYLGTEQRFTDLILYSAPA